MTGTARRSVLAGLGGLGCIGFGLPPLSAAVHRTYFVSPSGDDAHDGLTWNTALRTVAAINAAPLREGDLVLFERDGIWRECLVANQDGISFGAYGSGHRPVISAADRVSLERDHPVASASAGMPTLVALKAVAAGGATRAAAWKCCSPTLHDGAYVPASLDLNVGSESMTWAAMLPVEPKQVFVNGARGQRVASPSLVDDAGKWCWISGKLTVYGGSGGAPDVEVSARDYCFDANDRRNLRVQGLAFVRAGMHCVLLGAAHAPTVKDCRISEAFQNGIDFSSYVQHDNGLVENNILEEHGQGGMAGGGRMSGWKISRNTLRGCARLHNEMLGGIADHTWTYAIKIWGWREDRWHGSLLIENNLVEDCQPHSWTPPNSVPNNIGNGIWLDEIFNPKDKQRLINNIIINCNSRGIYFEKSDLCVAKNNIVDNCGRSIYTAGISIQGNYGRGAADNLVEFNTVRGGWWAAEFGGTGITAFDDNIVRYNIFVGSANQQLYVVGGGANAGGMGSGNRYYRNCLGPERTNFLVWQTVRSRLADFEAASGGRAYGNIARDPMLSAPDQGDWSVLPGSPCAGTAPGGANIGAR